MSATLVMMTLLAGGITPGLAPVEKIAVRVGVKAGSGISLAGAGGHTLMRRSPAHLGIEVMLSHPNVAWLEGGLGAEVELEGRVGFGLTPQARAMFPHKRFRPFGILGVPIFIAPYSLVGVMGGGGLEVILHPRVSVFAQFTTSVFFRGSDLMKDSALAKLDTSIGLRMHF